MYMYINIYRQADRLSRSDVKRFLSFIEHVNAPSINIPKIVFRRK